MRTAADFSAVQRFYRARRVLVTGHTGFKGSWLALWLARLGADVHGCALAPDQGPDNLFERACVAAAIQSAEIDVREPEGVLRYVAQVRPQVIFHLAARAWVQQGYEDPLATFATNTLGTTHVLEAARQTSSVDAVVCVTTDKVYRDRPGAPRYREDDELGGQDPYSASKAAAELVARCYGHMPRESGRALALATARGGNVIGGGDWSPHRVVPDIVRAIRARRPLRLRRPEATRPWQHALDLSYGYLLLGHRLVGETEHGRDGKPPEAWNFGPAAGDEMTVAGLVAAFLANWGEADYPVEHTEPPHHETTTLRLDSSRANQELGWQPSLNAAACVEWTADWYRRYLQDPDAAPGLVAEQLERFESLLAGTRSPARSPERSRGA
jgi:CDP-glucose 4,6-dehydratase